MIGRCQMVPELLQALGWGLWTMGWTSGTTISCKCQFLQRWRGHTAAGGPFEAMCAMCTDPRSSVDVEAACMVQPQVLRDGLGCRGPKYDSVADALALERSTASGTSS